MELDTFFFDTYAFIEMIVGNPAYQKFSNGVGVITSKLNLMELYYTLLLKYDQKVADKYFAFLMPFAIETDNETIKEAMIFRHAHKKRGLSYADCIGYVLARKHGVPFLTGDKEFADLEGVEFVK